MTLLYDNPATAGTTWHSARRQDWRGPDDAEAFYLNPIPSVGRSICVKSPDGGMRWLADYLSVEIEGLMRLPEGWDGERAKPVGIEAVEAVIPIVFALVTEVTLPPQLFPLPDGGLQVEWHVAGNDIEIEIDAEGRGHILATVVSGEIVIDEAVDWQQPASLWATRKMVNELSQRVARGR